MTNYYDILRVPRNAGPQEIASSYRYLLQHTFHERGGDSELSSLSQAYKTLTNPSKRQEYDRQLNIMAGQYQLKNPDYPTEAEKAYQDGLKAFERQNFQEAVQYFAKASRLEPAQGHFYSQWGLAIGMFPGRLPEAELYCKKAIEQDPDNPEFYFNLGFLYQRHNLGEAAQQSFARAQEAQAARQAKLGAQEVVPIVIPWDGDADTLLDELEDLEQAVDNVAQEEDKQAEVPGESLAPEAESFSDNSTQDLLKELDSLETSITGKEEPEPPIDAMPQETASAEPAPVMTDNSEVIQTLPQPEEVSSPELASEPDYGGSAALDLLKELDSIESMVNGTHQIPAEEPVSEPAPAVEELHPLQVEKTAEPAPEPELVEVEQAKQELAEPHPLELHEEPPAESSADELEREALNLLKELNVPLDEHLEMQTEPEPERAEPVPAAAQAEEPAEAAASEAPESPAAQPEVEPEPPIQPQAAAEVDSEAVKIKMERLAQMEEQMMEELMKLKAEREKLKSELKM